ncbi:MAG: rod shape-determining protein MreC [Proteobacteria bacterium]|nr:rod shape-determining protein MreC [Pseudomonadota bacterium]
MPDFWKRIGAPLVFGALTLLAVITMVSDRGGRDASERGEDVSWWQGVLLDVASPIQKAVAAPADGARRVWRDYLALLDVRDDNSRLKSRVAELEEENLQYREALVTSGHLQRIAEMRDEFETPMLASEVVGLDVSPWFRSVLVDRGSGHGVQAGNPVITSEGVVGLVTATSGGAARTMLLLDRQSAVDGIVQRSRARGIVRGRGTADLEFEFVVRGGDVVVGDVVITSGLAGVYPKGLRIGEVEAVPDPGGRLIQTALLRPAVDFGRLEQVFLMLRRGPTMDLLYGEGGAREMAGGRPAPAPGSAAPPAAPRGPAS